MKIRNVLTYVEFSIFKTKWMLLFFAVFALLLFKTSLENLLSDKIVIPYLAPIKLTAAINVLFGLLVLFLTIVLVNRLVRNYRVSPFKVFCFTIVSSIYLYYRISGNVWEFYNLRGLKLKLFDFVLIYTAFLIVLYIINIAPTKYKNRLRALIFSFVRLIKKQENTTEKPKEKIKIITPLIIDTALGENETDILNRTDHAIDIVNRLNITTSEKAITIGIHGEWGLGKSSFIRLMKNELEKDPNNILIDFNPWRGYKGNALSIDFFQALSQEVGKYNELLQADLKEYGDALLNVNSSFLHSTIKIVESVTETESVENRYKEINKALKKLDKKWYFFIDDWDRLSPNEIIEVIKLVRNTADFQNLRFILAYDKGYLMHALQKLNKHNYEIYLEKIISFEIPLLPIASEKTNDLFKAYLKEYSPEGEKKLLAYTNNQFRLRNTPTTLFLHTLRDVKRFANAFIPDYNKDYKEVDFIDFINLGLLRFKFYDVVNLLYFQRGQFLEEKGGILRLTKTSDLGKEYVIEKYIYDNSDSLRIGNRNITRLIFLLKELFELNQASESSLSDQSIMRSKNFSIYFRKEIDLHAISNKEFEILLESPLGKMEEVIQGWIEKDKRPSVTDKFAQYDIFNHIKDRTTYEKIIKAIFYLGNIPASKGNRWGYSDENLYYKLDQEKAIKRYYNNAKADFYSFVKSLLEEAIPPYKVESDLLNHISERIYLDDFVLNRQEVEERLVMFYEKYCNMITDPDATFWELYHKCKREVDNAGHKSKEYLPAANAVQRKFAFRSKETLKNYMENIINSNREEEDLKYAISGIVNTVFGSFEKFIKEVKSSNYINENFVNEFISFYESYELVKFQGVIVFGFNYLNVKRNN